MFDSPVAIMLIGIPGSGKSTIRKETNLKVICPDDIRAELCGCYADQSRNKEVFALANSRMKIALKNGENIIYDATNTTSHRKNLVSKLHEWGAGKVVGICMTTPLEVCKERNSKREFPVPEEVIDRMYGQLMSNIPSKADGFDDLMFI